MSAKAFASTGDLAEKTASFTELGRGLFAYTAEGDPNTGVIVGDDCCMVVDAQATPAMAAGVVARIREVTDKPVKYVLLSHYHAVRVLGASAFGASEIIASTATRKLIVERGEQDKASEIGRFPRLFRGLDTIPPGLTWPTLTFENSLTLWLGRRRVDIVRPGRGHTAGDTIAWVPDEGVMFSGDLVEHNSACYCGDAHLSDWPKTLDRLADWQPRALVPGRGAAVVGEQRVRAAIASTREFLNTLFGTASASVAKGRTLRETFLDVRTKMDGPFGHFAIYEHCLPFNVARAYDEARGIEWPTVWTAERDRELWDQLHG